MKIAIVHDYIKEYGGAERVLEAMHEIWPEAPVYTTVYLPKFLGPHMTRFKDWNIVTSWLQKIPFVEKLISPIRLISPLVFENWDFSEFDAVLVSATGAYFPNLLVLEPKTAQICYCHTPPRYLYGYPTARDWKKHWIGKVIGELINHKLRQVDFLASQRPDYFIANSEEVRQRIKKFYRRDALVIYPPVDISSKVKSQKSKVQVKSQNYFLTGGRLARAKHTDLAIEACNKLKLPLKVFGKGFADYGEELRKMAGSTIEFVGEVSDEELMRLYGGAKALIYPSELEDFGIMPVEAMAAGVPVVAFKSGGVKETVIDAHSASSGQGPTGVFFEEMSVESLTEAIKKLSKLEIQTSNCLNQAKKFSKERFKKEIKEFVESYARTS